MEHLGDITKIHGNEVPVVDIITGGSPCQDLSVAGKRAGLAGERSGLFMEQMRIVKEMRNESKRRLSIQGTDYDVRHIKPRFMVWENVAGAFSSGTPKGADFKAVLEEICKVVVKEVPDIPIPEKGWSYAGCIEGVGDDGTPFSIAWRLHDAQYWGVPQRRKRIALVADFGGNTAPPILFEFKSVSRNFESCKQEGQAASQSVGESTNESSSYTVKVRGGVEVDSLGHKAGKGALVQTELSGTLGVSQDQTLFQKVEPVLLESNQNHATIQTNGISTSLPAAMGEGGGYVPMVVDKPCAYDGSQIAPTLTANNADGSQRMPDKGNFNAVIGFDSYNLAETGDKGRCLATASGGLNEHVPCVYSIDEGARKSSACHAVCYGLDRASFNAGQNAKFDFCVEEDKAPTVVARGPGGVMTASSEACVQEITKE